MLAPSVSCCCCWSLHEAFAPRPTAHCSPPEQSKPKGLLLWRFSVAHRWLSSSVLLLCRRCSCCRCCCRGAEPAPPPVRPPRSPPPRPSASVVLLALHPPHPTRPTPLSSSWFPYLKHASTLAVCLRAGGLWCLAAVARSLQGRGQNVKDWLLEWASWALSLCQLQLDRYDEMHTHMTSQGFQILASLVMGEQVSKNPCAPRSILRPALFQGAAAALTWGGLAGSWQVTNWSTQTLATAPVS